MPRTKTTTKPWTRQRIAYVKHVLNGWYEDAHFVARGPGGDETDDLLERLERQRAIVMEMIEAFRATLPK
jgi:hypothetical protein